MARRRSLSARAGRGRGRRHTRRRTSAANRAPGSSVDASERRPRPRRARALGHRRGLRAAGIAGRRIPGRVRSRRSRRRLVGLPDRLAAHRNRTDRIVRADLANRRPVDAALRWTSRQQRVAGARPRSSRQGSGSGRRTRPRSLERIRLAPARLVAGDCLVRSRTLVGLRHNRRAMARVASRRISPGPPATAAARTDPGSSTRSGRRHGLAAHDGNRPARNERRARSGQTHQTQAVCRAVDTAHARPHGGRRLAAAADRSVGRRSRSHAPLGGGRPGADHHRDAGLVRRRCLDHADQRRSGHHPVRRRTGLGGQDPPVAGQRRVGRAAAGRTRTADHADRRSLAHEGAGQPHHPSGRRPRAGPGRALDPDRSARPRSADRRRGSTQRRHANRGAARPDRIQ